MSHIMEILPDVTSNGSHNFEYYFVSIRDRLRWLSAAGHERVLLLKRRYDGQLCPFTSTVRHSSQQHVQDTICYGTNFISPNVDLANIPGYSSDSATSITLPDGQGGYFHSIEITASLLALGPDTINAKDAGWNREYSGPRCWTLWEPLLEKGDIIVRRDGQRFMITEVHVCRFRHYVTHQKFSIAHLETNHPIYALPLGLS